jgi:hypothetical protein
MFKNILITLLLTVLLISSCSSPGITYTPPALEEGWSIRMIQSGGIAGVNRAVEVLSDGSYTVYQQAGGEAIKGQLTDAELSQLRELIANLEITSVRTETMCADCFEYDIEINTGGKKMTVQLDDITLPDSGVEELVAFLRGLIDSAPR